MVAGDIRNLAIAFFIACFTTVTIVDSASKHCDLSSEPHRNHSLFDQTIPLNPDTRFNNDRLIVFLMMNAVILTWVINFL